MAIAQFHRYSGSGNFFLITDIEEKQYSSFSKEKICAIANSIQHRVDGVILIETRDSIRKMHYFNRDGGRASMCGNGLRCAIQYMYDHLYQQKEPYILETDCGDRSGTVYPDGTVQVDMGIYSRSHSPERIDLFCSSIESVRELFFFDTGVPHVILFSKNIDDEKVDILGKEIRYHPLFQPNGTNVNFVEILSHTTVESSIKIRTYERGVEDETGACGTGATAASLVLLLKSKILSTPFFSHTIKILFKSGEIGSVDCHETNRSEPNRIETFLRASATALDG